MHVYKFRCIYICVCIYICRSILRIDSFALEFKGASLPLLQLTQMAPVTVRDAPVVQSGSQLVTVCCSVCCSVLKRACCSVCCSS